MFEYLITRPMGFIIEHIYNLVSNYGLAIIIFTILIKLILIPLNIHSQKAMKKQQTDKPIDEELLMRMMAGETEKPQGNGDAPGTEETGQEAEEPEQETEKGETAVPMENRVAPKVADGKVQDGKRRKAKQAATTRPSSKGWIYPPVTESPCMCGVNTTSGSPKSP